MLRPIRFSQKENGLRIEPLISVGALMACRLSPKARTDLDDIADYIARDRDVATAQRVIDTITESFQLLESHPYAGRALDADLGRGRRSFATASHIVIYRIEGGDVLVLRVINARRDLPPLLRT